MIEARIRPYRYLLPVASAVLYVLSLPPYTFFYLSFVAWVPLFFAFLWSDSKKEAFFVGVSFALVLFGIQLVSLVSGFRWLPDLWLFAMVAKGFMYLLWVGVTVLTGIFSVAVYWMLRRCSSGPCLVVVAFLSYLIYALTLKVFFFNIPFFSLTYAVIELDAFSAVYARWGFEVTAFSVFVINMLLFFLCRKKYKSALVGFTVLLLFFGLTVWLAGGEVSESSDQSIQIAIIQDASRDRESLYGRVQDGKFSYPKLEEYVSQIVQQASGTDMIIYPLAPWDGILLPDESSNRYFPGDVSVAVFQDWVRRYIPPGIVFVTWHVTAENGRFYNDIGYWYPDGRYQRYRKEKLFPFLDYTPQWMLDRGIVSLPYDASAGNDNTPFLYNGGRIGGLVCSEVMDTQIAKKQATENDILLAIGSESFVIDKTVSQYNYLNTKMRALETGKTIVRANKFGPSAVIDGNGKVRAYVPYGKEEILYSSISLSR